MRDAGQRADDKCSKSGLPEPASKRDAIVEDLKRLLLTLDRELPSCYSGVVALKFVFQRGKLREIVRAGFEDYIDVR